MDEQPNEQTQAAIARLAELSKHPWEVTTAGIRAVIAPRTNDYAKVRVCPLAAAVHDVDPDHAAQVLEKAGHDKFLKGIESLWSVMAQQLRQQEAEAETPATSAEAIAARSRRCAAGQMVHVDPAGKPATAMIGIDTDTARHVMKAADLDYDTRKTSALLVETLSSEHNNLRREYEAEMRRRP